MDRFTSARLSALLLLCLVPSCALAQVTQKVKVRATFYSAASDPSDTTATGRKFSLPGIAVDPRFIPYGSHVTVPGYGSRIADDSGRLVKGRRIDIRLPLASRGELRRLGTRKLTITVKPPRRKKASHV